jgi:hypothetical protein
MPTGYTSSIYDNKNDSFESFVLSCARAFGPCMHQRDDDMRDKPKLRELDIQYHLDALEQAKNYKKPTKAEFEVYKKEKIEEAYASLKKDKELRERYTVMLEKVKNWTPPTPDHERLKKFMIEQLQSSIEYDCNENYHENDISLYKKMKYSDYLRELNSSNKRTIEYHTEQIEKEKKNVDRANRWITALYESLEIV